METIVISVGGSLIAPENIDTQFLNAFKELVLEETGRKGRRFIIICGGGKTARDYQNAAREIGMLDSEDLDWLGIHATRLNGHLLRTMFRDIAHPEMITNPDDVRSVPEDMPVIVAAGYRPGASSDLRAVQIATHVGATRLVNLSNIDYVYTADPKENPDAEKIENITWSDFRALLPSEWDPGLSAPFDPIAAREAEKHAMEVAIINGAKLDALAAYLRGEPFTGTKIHK